MPIQSIEPRRLYRQIADQIRGLVRSGEYRAGSRLPPERDLAQRFNVGRNTLREAIKVLEIFGVVDRAPRSGTVIRNANLDNMLAVAFAGLQITPKLVEDIQGFRLLIELGIASVVIARIDDRALRALEALIGRMAATRDLREQAVWDYEFHLAIVQLAGNAVVSRTYRVMAEPMNVIRRLPITIPMRASPLNARLTAVLRFIGGKLGAT